jgi:hypothetical protein
LSQQNKPLILKQDAFSIIVTPHARRRARQRKVDPWPVYGALPRLAGQGMRGKVAIVGTTASLVAVFRRSRIEVLSVLWPTARFDRQGIPVVSV